MIVRLLLRFLRYLNSVYADECRMNRYRGRAEVSAFMTVFILALDLHRYGAWYRGNASFLRPYAIPVLLIVSSPFIIYVLASLLRWFVCTGRYNMLAFCAVTVFLYCAIMMFWWPALLPARYDWLTMNLPWYLDTEFLVKVLAPALPASFVAYMLMPQDLLNDSVQ
jgi:hypothetical protein